MASLPGVREAFSSENGGFEGTDPESCVLQLGRRHNLKALKKTLRQADQQWMEEFLGCGGLQAIFNAFSVLEEKHLCSVANAVPQLECVECLKAVMNSPYRLESMINSGTDKFVHRLVLGKLMAVTPTCDELLNTYTPYYCTVYM